MVDPGYPGRICYVYNNVIQQRSFFNNLFSMGEVHSIC